MYFLSSLPISFVTLVGYVAMTRLERRWEKKADDEVVALESGKVMYGSTTYTKRRHAFKRQREAWFIIIAVAIFCVPMTGLRLARGYNQTITNGPNLVWREKLLVHF